MENVSIKSPGFKIKCVSSVFVSWWITQDELTRIKMHSVHIFLIASTLMFGEFNLIFRSFPTFSFNRNGTVAYPVRCFVLRDSEMHH